MESVYRDLLIGIIGSVIGALIVYFSSYGLNLTKAARLRHAQRVEQEKLLWRTRKIQVRMEITNNYLFEILKAFLIASILTLVPSLILYGVFSQLDEFAARRLIYGVATVFTVIGLIYYFIALGKALRYLRIRRTDEDYLNTYLDEEKK
jgi:uncharacterized membrane protein YdjX (TVP38/TMEM64 family)